jgi:hypothetical protein
LNLAANVIVYKRLYPSLLCYKTSGAESRGSRARRGARSWQSNGPRTTDAPRILSPPQTNTAPPPRPYSTKHFAPAAHELPTSQQLASRRTQRTQPNKAPPQKIKNFSPGQNPSPAARAWDGLQSVQATITRTEVHATFRAR